MTERQNFSYSKIATYLECPKKYELQIIRNLSPFKDNVYSSFGSAIHKAIQLALQKKYNFDECIIIFEKEFKEHLKQIDPKEAQLVFISEWIKKAKQILEYYFKEFDEKFKKDNVEIIGVEKYFSYEIQPNIFYNGIIDLLIKHLKTIKETIKVPTIKILKSGKQKTIMQNIVSEKKQTFYTILDWKTGTAKPKENLQLLSYTVPLLYLENVIVNDIEYVYLKNKRIIKFLVDNNRIVQTKDKIISIINNIIKDTQNNNFKMCTDSKICRFCNVKQFCDIDFKKSLELEKSKQIEINYKEN